MGTLSRGLGRVIHYRTGISIALANRSFDLFAHLMAVCTLQER